MDDLTIVRLGTPVLRLQAEEVHELDDEVRDLPRRMFSTMYAGGGQGLAAPQVGISRRIAVVDVPPGTGDRYVLINPRILAVSEERARAVEGCLSLPRVREIVERPAEVLIEAMDPSGAYLRLEAGGDLARCLLHEMDHLDGVLYIDHLTPLARKMLLRRYHKLQVESRTQKR
ncbi:peptide deformylase [Gemmatimonadota bacterium]